tara:strand:- start:2148 stop:2249 length:102 start_codon:yes stop_codon:yes gene_type:complete
MTANQEKGVSLFFALLRRVLWINRLKFPATAEN